MAGHTFGLFENDANKRLITRLKERGADLRLFPGLAAKPVKAPPDLRLSEFDWLIFPDPYSVDHFLENIGDKFALDELRICALGEAVSDRLRFSQIHADVIPADRLPRTIVSSIAAYQPLSGLDFLIPTPAGPAGNFADLLTALRENGAGTQLLPVYEISPVPDLSRFTTLLGGGAVDEFIFTSPQDVFNFAWFIEPAKAELTAAAADENTFNTLREFGLRPGMYK